MRQMISGLVAAVAVMTAGAAPASACGWGIGCCGGAWASPCVTYAPTTAYAPTVTYVPTTTWGYWGCGSCGWGGWGFERLVEPTTQYYYVNQGPTYSGPGAFAPYPTYHENAIPYPYSGGRYTNYGAGSERGMVYPYRWRHHYHYRPLRHYSDRQG